jgi:hypothetical protein
MRQQTPLSRVLPFSFDYQGEHPAGLWLLYALQKHSFHLVPPVIFSEPLGFYAVDQSFLGALSEPGVQFPLEWCAQSLKGQLTYSGSGADAKLVDTSAVAIDCLDIPTFCKHLSTSFESYVAPATPDLKDTQPLPFAWEWQDAVPETRTPGPRPWCISGELPGVEASFGVLQTYCTANVTAYFCYRPETQTTRFTVEILAENSGDAVKSMVKQSALLSILATSGVIHEDWLQQNLKSATLFWPTISWDGARLLIRSQKPDLRPASLKIEGYCWGLMAHLFCYLNTRYSSPELVFQRLQHFDQKMHGVLSSFL